MALDLTGIGTAIESVTGIIEHFTESKTEAEKNKLQLSLAKLNMEVMAQQREADLVLAQLKINEVEAANPSVFVAGWRPFIGWICAGSLAYAMVIQNLLSWLSVSFGGQVLPEIQADVLMAVLGSILGVSFNRTQEKIAGVATKQISGTINQKSINN